MVQFNYGKNWQNYSNNALSQEKLEEAEESLKDLIGENNLKGKSFLDIGSGSGIFSIAAYNLGTTKTVGFDLYKESVEVSFGNKNKFAPSTNISFFQKSILDNDILQFEKFDIVYSWGVLCLTGKMWQAIDNSMQLVKDDGLYVIAIYNRHWTSFFWHKIKYMYNIFPKFVQKLMVYFFLMVRCSLMYVKHFNEPAVKKRGMSHYYDAVDWLGGYPYEYASIEEVVEHCTKKGFVTVKTIPTLGYTGCNEFVFKKAKK